MIEQEERALRTQMAQGSANTAISDRSGVMDSGVSVACCPYCD
ncbi:MULTISPECIES: hypothetical protein [unclassified Pseudoalteromonas]|nr:hypothetical protein [Pseudoalteromonas sp. XMcav2-N]